MPNAPEDNPDPIEKSLGDQATGADLSRAEQERSLGDQSTSGDALSSMSDLVEGLGEALDSDLPLIDLAARYEIEGELGQGGMGAVLLATDRQLKRKVAIKRILGSLTQSKTALQRFVTEAQSIAALNHFNIVQVYEFGRDTEGPLLVLEYVAGGSLLDRLKGGKLEIEEAVDITCQLCDALTIAHEQGIIHRDIKPANILLTKRGEPKLTDFGLARQDMTDHGQTQAGAVLGTIDFMSPEQRRDATATDARSDLWSLAATLYQMLTGSSPKVIRLDQLPGNMAPVIGKMLEENPDKRYASAEEFKAELRKGLASEAPTVSADLVAGACPACSTTNELSRKFCRGCGKDLRAQCLSCNTTLPVWENFCGECGVNQQQLQKQIRQEMKETIEEAVSFARSHEYDKALKRANAFPKEEYAFAQDLQQNVLEQIDVITAQRAEQYELRDQLVELANQHQTLCDYAAVVRELVSIPEPLRTDLIITQLTTARAVLVELTSLKRQINEDIKANRAESVLEKTARFLELKPGHSKIEALRQKAKQAVARRQQQAEQQKELTRAFEELREKEKALAAYEQGAVLADDEKLANELTHQAEQQYLQYDDEAVLTTLDNWPKSIKDTPRSQQLRKLAENRLDKVEWLKSSIAQSRSVQNQTLGSPARRLNEINRYLELRPNDLDAKRERESLCSKVWSDESGGEVRDQRNDTFVGIISFVIFVVGLAIVLWWAAS